MKELFRNVIQQVVEVEMDGELGWERFQRTAGKNASVNCRNGNSQKTVKTQLSEIDIKAPCVFAGTWRKQYPSCVRSWEVLNAFFEYPPEILRA